MKLSIIIPVYKVENYLHKCVDSVLNQDYNDYEVILVDDGSTDNSPQICDEYVSAFEIGDCKLEIKCIHQKNGGLSAARNAGLKVATGEYVCFVDSDDYWEENVLGGLMEQIEREKLDVLRFDYRNVRIVDSVKCKVEGVKYEVFEPNKKPRYIDRGTEVVEGETYLNERMSYACYAVMFIIKRSLIYNDGMRKQNESLALNEPLSLNDACLFREGIFFEDTEWTPRMLVRAKRVNATTTIVYNYLTRSGSITKKYDKEHIRKKNESLVQVNLSLQSLLTKVKDGRWLRGCMADNAYCILNNAAAYDYNSVSYWIGLIKENRMLPLRGYKVRKMTLWRYKLINLLPRLYCWLRHARMTCLKK